jgi:hypothetical protein
MSVGFGFGHEVSNPAQSVLKLRGPAPRAKVSMRRMRPAQQGQALTGADVSERSAVCGARNRAALPKITKSPGSLLFWRGLAYSAACAFGAGVDSIA